MASGEYSEDIGKGGRLVVDRSGWQLKYYWSGPDLRYNGTFGHVPGREIERYVQAWELNFEKYLELKKMLPSEGEFVQQEAMRMEIRVNTLLSEGVCLKSYHCCVATKEELRQMVQSYQKAKEKALLIQKMLAELP